MKGIHVIVVLGQALLQGNVPQLSLISRVLTALSLLRYKNVEEKYTLLLSGGTPTHSSSTISEAAIMKNLVLSSYKEKDPFDSIILEYKSTNTIENAINCRSIIYDDPGCIPSKVSVVTSDFHIPRTRCIFNNIFESLGSNMCYVSSDSYLDKCMYRSSSLRPKSIDMWSLPERLDVELLAIEKLPIDMKRYGFTVTDESLKQVREELQAMRKIHGVIDE